MPTKELGGGEASSVAYLAPISRKLPLLTRFTVAITSFRPLPPILIRVCLDVDIEDLGIEFDTIPNQTSFGNGSQCQSDCLDVDELLDRNQRANKYQIVFGWACRQIQN